MKCVKCAHFENDIRDDHSIRSFREKKNRTLRMSEFTRRLFEQLACKYQTTMEALQRVNRKAFIFQHEYNRLIRSKSRQEERGNLFGLWTTDCEPIIHIISGPICCSERNQYGLHTEDIVRKSFPLAHIGNWRYSDSQSQHSQRDPLQLKDRQCLHKLKPNFLHVSVTESPFRVSINDAESEIVILPNESPFRRMHEIEQITADGDNEDSSTEPTRSTSSQGNSEDSDFDHSEVMKQPLGTKGFQKAFIFRKDYHMILSKATQEKRGNLFGLWTNDDEPVIHVISGPNCCPRSDSHLTDILSKDSPLTHIGNWRYGSASAPRAQRNLTHQIDELWCVHSQKPKFLDVTVLKSEILLQSVNGRERKLEVLSAESPLKYMSGIKRITIEGQKQDSDTEQAIEGIKYLSLAKGRETFNFPEDEDAQAINIDDFNRRRRSHEGPMHLGTQRFQSEFSVNRHDFKVFMFEEDHQMMTDLVLKYPSLETGGDLFGLWTTKGNAVLQVVLGPGQNCKRTGVSFYQDISYLQQNGELLTEDYMLCHIGEWHSHHQLRLFQPSGGDSSTVIRNYPRGACGFLLIIANILSPREVELSPYLYTKTSSHGFDQKGELVILRARNAFKSIRRLKEKLDRGKELYTYSQDGLHRYSDYLPNCHETRKYPYQSGQIIKPLLQTREYTARHHKPKQTLRDSRQYQPTPKLWTYKHLPQSGKTRSLTSASRNIRARVNKRKSAKRQNELHNRPKWRP